MCVCDLLDSRDVRRRSAEDCRFDQQDCELSCYMTVTFLISANASEAAG